MTDSEPRTVWLVRHGEVDNPNGLTYGRLPGFGLSERGQKQARQAGAHLDVLRGDRQVRLLSSPLTRARETAEILGESLHASPDFDDRLIEAGSMREGLPRRFAPLLVLQRLLDPQKRALREPALQVARRMRYAVSDQLARSNPDEVLIMVSHQLPIWMARAAFEFGVGSGDEGLQARYAPLSLLRGKVDYCALLGLRFSGGVFLGCEEVLPLPQI